VFDNLADFYYNVIASNSEVKTIMLLNLNDIVGRPGARKPFQFFLTLPDLTACTMHGPFQVSGYAVNVAGALELRGEVQVDMTCTCDRCMTPFRVEKTLPVTAYLAETLTDEENPDIFLLEKGAADLDEIFTTAFLLGLESKVVCSEDCAGLCPICGVNLNEGPCACNKEVDPRLAALQQLLE